MSNTLRSIAERAVEAQLKRRVKEAEDRQTLANLIRIAQDAADRGSPEELRAALKAAGTMLQ